MTYNVLIGTLRPTRSLTHSRLGEAVRRVQMLSKDWQLGSTCRKSSKSTAVECVQAQYTDVRKCRAI